MRENECLRENKKNQLTYWGGEIVIYFPPQGRERMSDWYTAGITDTEVEVEAKAKVESQSHTGVLLPVEW